MIQEQLPELWEWEIKLSQADINSQSLAQGFLSIPHLCVVVFFCFLFFNIFIGV